MIFGSRESTCLSHQTSLVRSGLGQPCRRIWVLDLDVHKTSLPQVFYGKWLFVTDIVFVLVSKVLRNNQFIKAVLKIL